MSETYDLFQQGREHLKKGMAAQATSRSRRRSGASRTRRRSARRSGSRTSASSATRRPRREFRAMLDISPADDYAHYALGRALEKQGERTRQRPLKLAELAAAGQRALRRARSATSSRCGRSSSASPRRASLGRRRGAWGRSGPGCASCSGSRRRRRGRGPSAWPARIARLRIFENEEGSSTAALLDVGGAVLVVSQFTLIADTAKGNRPSFSEAAPPGGGRAALRALLRGARGPGRPRSRRASSARAWPSSSSTTGLSRSSSTAEGAGPF